MERLTKESNSDESTTGNSAVSDSGASESDIDFESLYDPNSQNASLDTVARGISVHNAGGTARIRKRRTQAAKPNCRKKPKQVAKLKANKKLPYLANPYFNFLRVFRIRYCDEPQDSSINQKAAFFWSKLSAKQRALFKPENLKKGVPALSILNHLEIITQRQENSINELSSNDSLANADSDPCCHKKRKPPCSKKQKRSRRKKSPSRPKRRSNKSKKRPCKPKKRVCRPEPKCRPKPRR